MDFLSLKEIFPQENTLSFMFMSVNRNLLEWLLKVTLEWKERKYQNYCPIRNNYERWSEVMVMRGSDNKSEVKEKPVDFQEENGHKGWTGENEGMLLESWLATVPNTTDNMKHDSLSGLTSHLPSYFPPLLRRRKWRDRAYCDEV